MAYGLEHENYYRPTMIIVPMGWGDGNYENYDLLNVI